LTTGRHPFLPRENSVAAWRTIDVAAYCLAAYNTRLAALPIEQPMNDRTRKLLSGQSRGVLPSLARAGLGVASVAYGVAVQYRNRRFDAGTGVHRADVPVISIGNLTAGGTGKTPVVAFVANYFRRWGVKVALLSRGYGARGGECNDEALVLERLCPGTPHVQQPDRVAGAALALLNFNSELLILDDGFQHRKLARDLDIVLIDATNPFGFGHLLPRGLLREPIANLRRADIILLTRADSVPRNELRSIQQSIAHVAPGVPVGQASFPPTRLVNSSGDRRTIESLEEVPALAFCGIGNPAGFAATLKAARLHPCEIVTFGDHYAYRPQDLAKLALRAEAFGVAAAVTTLKDLVKIGVDHLPAPSGVPLWAVETGCELTTDDNALLERLDDFVRQVAAPRAA
jgi:tetraacyldisaccharide 4'-kinase